MGLVTTWLSGIGLSHAIPAFKAAGIVTPAALAELDLAFYEALGVEDPADRRKLFYLVQRIKMAADHDDEPDSAQETIEQVVSRTLSSKSSKQKLILQEEDSIDDDEEDEDEDHDVDDEDDDIDNDEVLNAPTARQRNTRLSSNHGRKSLSNRLSTGKVLGKKSRNSDVVKENKQTNLLGSKPTNPTSRSGATPVVSRTRSGRRIKQEENAMDEVKENRSNESWGEDESLIADDELSSVGKSGGRRQSRRLQEKKRKSVESTSSAGLVVTEEEEEQEEDMTEHESKPRRNASSRRKLSVSQGYTGDAETTKRRLSSSNRRMKKSTSDRDADDESSDKKALTRKSGMQAPRTRRFESKLQNPTRTGKRLSTIPSNSVAPMSPLVDLPLKKPEADGSTQQENGRKKKAASERDSSRTLKRSDSTSGSDQDCKPGRSRRRRSVDKKPTSGSDTEVQNTRRRSVRLSNGGMSSRGNRSNSTGRTSRKSIDFDPSKGKKNARKGAVLVHGTPEDNSWFGQIARIREDNDSEHKLFGGNLENDNDEDMRIRVIVRKRPMSTTEKKSSKEVDVIHPLDYDGYGRVLVYQPKTRVDLTREIDTIPFAYDNVFDESSSNKGIYERTVRSIIPNVFEDGKWASVFAYGQTGSGKTFTMMGCNVTGIRAGKSVDNRANYGLYYMAALDVFEMAEMEEFSHMSIGISLFEIYGGKLFDLLNKRNQIRCLEDSRGKVCFPGLSEHPVTCAEEVMEVIEDGARKRSTGTTSKNADSSRSHAILQIHVRKSAGRKKNVEHGRLTFIDLAGSERGADTDKANRATRLEGAEINTSLLALKEVIRALATGDSMAHIPFRGSKLTQVLKESFVGENSCSVMIACVAPNLSNCEHTLNTLRYADRVKERNSEDGTLSASLVNNNRARSLKLSSRRLSIRQENDNSIEKLPSEDYEKRHTERVREKNSNDRTLSASVVNNNRARSFKLSKRLSLGQENGNSIDSTSEKSSSEDYEESYTDRVEEKNSEERTLSASVVKNNRASPLKPSKRVSLGQENDNSIDIISEKLSSEKYVESYISSDDDDDDHVGNPTPTDEEIKRDKEDEERQINFATVMSPNTHHDTHVIEELLAQSPESGIVTANSRKMKNASDLVSTHRECMAEMLTMCKEEMTLANTADGDRDNIDVYLSELSKIHERQCTMLATLHDKLTQFREMKTMIDDESFEDLRE